MLRSLVLLFLLLNAALFFWIRSDPPQLRPDREPQRLEHQVSPDAIQVLPDLPTASEPAGVTSIDFTNLPASAASAASAAGASVGTAASDVAGAASTTLARQNGDATGECAESGALDDAQVAALRVALAKAGVAPDAISERKQAGPSTWLIYMGRFSDSQTWQEKADELRRLNVKFDRVTQPASLSPGLSLGSFASRADATAHLADLAKHGVKTARVVEQSASGVGRHLQVRSPNAAWRLAVGGPHLNACPVESAAAL